MRTARSIVVALVLAAGPVAAADEKAPAKAADRSEKDLQEKALKLNTDIRTEDDFSAKMKELLKDKPGTAALVKAAAKLQKAAKKDDKQPFRFYAALALGRAAQVVKDYDAAELFYSFCVENAINDLQSGKLIVTAVDNLLDFYWDRKKYDKVEDLAGRFLALDGDETVANAKIPVMERRILAVAKQGDTDKALEQAEKLVQAFDGFWYILQIRGEVEREAGKLDDALKTYEKVVEKIDESEKMPADEKKRLIRNVKYRMSGIHVENKQLDKGAEILKQLMKDDPDNATFPNDLGFIWADHDMNLDESEELIRKAIKLDLEARKKALTEGKIDEEAAKKANPAYVDSLGWVLYKKGKYEEALKHLLEAAGGDDEESNHIEIWDHVGDTYLALGKKKEALETFQKALKMDDVTKKDAERRRKVTEKIRKLKAELK
jgi:tetratricopeptide (TPR) repeat protein